MGFTGFYSSYGWFCLGFFRFTGQRISSSLRKGIRPENRFHFERFDWFLFRRLGKGFFFAFFLFFFFCFLEPIWTRFFFNGRGGGVSSSFSARFSLFFSFFFGFICFLGHCRSINNARNIRVAAKKTKKEKRKTASGSRFPAISKKKQKKTLFFDAHFLFFCGLPNESRLSSVKSFSHFFFWYADE